MPEIASRRHLELRRRRRSPTRSSAPASTLDDVDQVAVTRGPGLIGALLVGLSAAKALAAARELPLTPVDHLHGHVVASTLGDDPIEPPYLCLVASGGHTFLARVDDPAALQRSSARRSTTPPARRSTRAPGCSASATPAARRSTGSPRDGDPAAFDFPRSAPGDGLDFSFSGLKTSLLYTVRDLGEARPSGAAPTSPPPTSARSSTRSSTRARAGARARPAWSGSRSAAAWRPTPSCARRSARLPARRVCASPPRELCTDNAAMIAGAARFTASRSPYPDYLALDASGRGSSAA